MKNTELKKLIKEVSKSNRKTKETFLISRGWVRLTERADIWIDTKQIGLFKHDVWLFDNACQQEMARVGKQIKVIIKIERKVDSLNWGRKPYINKSLTSFAESY
jgi:hypothetical protein